MSRFPRRDTLRARIVMLFVVAGALHTGIPILFWLVDMPHRGFWAAIFGIAFCAVVMTTAIVLVNSAMQRIDEITAVALNFGSNPNRRQKKLAEQGTAEVRQAVQAFNAMRKQIQNLLHERDDMFTAIAHNIRTPLARIQMASEMLSDARLRENIQNNIREISVMLEKGMTLAKSGLSAEEPRLLDLVSFVENLAEELSQVSPQVQGHFADLGERICVKARPSGIEICLRNLVSNAVAYGKSRVTVTVSATEKFAFVDIIDNGPGIPDCSMERVMQPFFRLESSRDKNPGGLGLGLSIAQNAAKLDEGEIRLSNRKEGGVQARLVLPRRALPE